MLFYRLSRWFWPPGMFWRYATCHAADERKVGEGGREKSSNVHRRDRGAVGYSGILPSDRCPQLLRLHVLPLCGVSLCSHIYMYLGGGAGLQKTWPLYCAGWVVRTCRGVRYGTLSVYSAGKGCQLATMWRLWIRSAKLESTASGSMRSRAPFAVQ